MHYYAGLWKTDYCLNLNWRISSWSWVFEPNDSLERNSRKLALTSFIYWRLFAYISGCLKPTPQFFWCCPNHLPTPVSLNVFQPMGTINCRFTWWRESSRYPFNAFFVVSENMHNSKRNHLDTLLFNRSIWLGAVARSITLFFTARKFLYFTL